MNVLDLHGSKEFSPTHHVYKTLATRIGHKTQNREITDLFAGGAIVLLLAGGGLSALWFRRVP